jgi:hypothetical protein
MLCEQLCLFMSVADITMVSVTKDYMFNEKMVVNNELDGIKMKNSSL